MPRMKIASFSYEFIYFLISTVEKKEPTRWQVITQKYQRFFYQQDQRMFISTTSSLTTLATATTTTHMHEYVCSRVFIFVHTQALCASLFRAKLIEWAATMATERSSLDE